MSTKKGAKATAQQAIDPNESKRETYKLTESLEALRATLGEKEEVLVYKGVEPQGLIVALANDGKNTVLRTGMKPRECGAFMEGVAIGRSMR